MNKPFHASSNRCISHVYIRVVDLRSMVHFYHDLLGFELISSSHQHVVLGFEKRSILTLVYEPNTFLETTRTQGLYHVAYLVPNVDDFVGILRYLSTRDYPLEGLADHGVSMAVYLRDPEGNGIEIYVDRKISDWPYVDGQLNMVTDPLDVQTLFKQISESNKLPPSTIIGHLHLHVGDLQQSFQFYQQLFGYHITQQYGSQAVFLSDGSYHHHLGLNTWNGRNIPSKNQKTTGLIGYRIESIPIIDKEDPSGFIINPKKQIS